MVENVLKNRYEIIAELGKGGMSTVYLAKDLKLESYWAVKKVKFDSSVDIEAFKMEVELLSTLNHSDIPRIVDRMEIDNYYYVIMDFIDGVSLKKKVQTEGPQTEKTIVEWAKMLCDILIYLHTVKANPIVYRDMKPDNIMLTQNGRVKLIDFGIAKECRRNEPQMGIGTPGYASPEQYGSSNLLDERSDIYSLGATLYYLATGETPKKPPNGVKSVRQANSSMSEGLDYIIRKCTQDNPDDRYNNCYELKDDLNNIEKMTGAYHRQMRNRLIGFSACIVAFIISVVIGVVGYNGMEGIRKENYLYYYNEAQKANGKGNDDLAAEYYEKAISYDGSHVDTYIEYWNTLLPKSDDESYESKLKAAINMFRNSYIDKRESKMYENEQLMYIISKKCLELTDAGYISYASKYLKTLSDKKFGAEEVLSYKIIADNLSKGYGEIEFDKLYFALLDLENYTDGNVMTTDEKLNNYYNLMKAYSQYPSRIKGESEDETYAYDKIASIGEKAREVIKNSTTEEIKFNGIIKMNELVASFLCDEARVIPKNDKDRKKKIYEKALQWFDYLDDYEVELDSELQLKRAGAYMGIYENADEKNSKTAIDNLGKAIAKYENIVKNDDTNFIAKVYFTEALLKMERTKIQDERDYKKVMSNYKSLESQYKSMAVKSELSDAEKTLYSSLKNEMKQEGLIE